MSKVISKTPAAASEQLPSGSPISTQKAIPPTALPTVTAATVTATANTTASATLVEPQWHVPRGQLVQQPLRPKPGRSRRDPAVSKQELNRVRSQIYRDRRHRLKIARISEQFQEQATPSRQSLLNYPIPGLHTSSIHHSAHPSQSFPEVAYDVKLEPHPACRLLSGTPQNSSWRTALDHDAIPLSSAAAFPAPPAKVNLEPEVSRIRLPFVLKRAHSRSRLWTTLQSTSLHLAFILLTFLPLILRHHGHPSPYLYPVP